LVGAPLLIAATVSLLLGGAIIAGAVIVSRPAAPPAGAHADALEEQRRLLAQERQKLAEERARGEADRKKQADFRRVMKRAERALATRQFGDAKKAYKEALELIPTDAEALEGLQAATASLAAAEKASETDAAKKKEADRLLAEGQKAMADKQYAAAVRVLTLAQQTDPANRPVLDALLAAQKALDADKDEKQKLADYRKHMDLGKAAMAQARYADAVKEYAAAQQAMPDDLEAQQGQKLAEAKILALDDKDKRQKAFENLLERARRAQLAKRYKEATASLNAALRINAGDREAARLLREAEKALRDAKSESAKLQAQAKAAADLGRLAEAKRLLESARANWAEDDAAEKMLRDVDRLAALATTNQAAYLQAVQAGVLAMAAGRYADAVTAYTQALALNPGDFDSAQALKKAQAALAVQVKAQLDYNRLVAAGALALKQGMATTAIRAFRDALRLVPGDPTASDGLAQAQSMDRYNRAMQAGGQALTNRQRQAAVNAFNAALAEKPGDAKANFGLRKANLLR
jgi:tetratricopeptide (TPR) repeat protein